MKRDWTLTEGYLVALRLCERAMERPGELQFHLHVRRHHVHKDSGLQNEMKYSLADAEREMHTTHLQLANATITVLHYFLNILH